MANNQKKLNESNVRMIRRLLHSGLSQAEVAEHFPVRQETIGAIQRGLIWKNVH